MGTHKKAILFTAKASHGNINRILAGLASGLEAEGVTIRTVNTSAPDTPQQLHREIDSGEIDFFLGMVGIGLDMSPRHNIFNQLGRPFVSVYLDPLVLYADQVRTPIHRRLITTTSDCDLEYWSQATPDLPIRHLPHAADTKVPGPWQVRDITILFPASGGGDPEAMRNNWATAHGKAVAERLNAVLEESDARHPAPLTDAISHVLKDIINVENPLAVHPYFATIDVYLRLRERWRMLKNLIGLPVVVAGAGWESFAADNPSHGFSFLGPRPATDVQTMMTQAKLVVNTCTGHHGSHERVFDAQAAGALAVTTPTRWFRSEAREAPDTLFLFESINGRETLENLLHREADIAARAHAGHIRQTTHHTWQHRARDILGWLDRLPE